MHAPLAELIGRTRFVVLVAVAGVLLVAMALFVLGAGMAVHGVWKAGLAVLQGDLASTTLTVEFLEIVSMMLKAVVFYIIGIGMYSLFIAPLNLTTALGVETLNDLEIKIVSVVVVIMAITFLEHFILWEQPVEILLFGVALGVVVAALVFFQNHAHRARQELQQDEGPVRARAQRELFEEDREQRATSDPMPAEESDRPSDGRPPNGRGDARREDAGRAEGDPAGAARH